MTRGDNESKPASAEPPRLVPHVVSSPSRPGPHANADRKSSWQIPKATSGTSELLQSRWIILGTLFGITGALGLPFLWISPAFTTKEKWIWSLVNTLYTAVLIGLTIMILMWAMSVYENAFR